MTLTQDEKPRASAESGVSEAHAWLRALELTAPIVSHPKRLLATVIEELAETQGDAPALISDRENITYRELAERVNQYTRWALAQRLGIGDTVCLLMPNRPEYMAIWLGISRTGCAVALLNTSLAGHSLEHCIELVAPRHMIVAATFVDKLSAARNVALSMKVWVHGSSRSLDRRIDVDIERYSGERLQRGEQRNITIDNKALYIYTSGTTGLPKAANVSHGRLMQWSHWFAGMMGTSESDRLYNCLPMYHSIGGVVAPGSVLVSGGSVVLREKFSASQFWNDVTRYDCTLFQYIGELCRYLVHSPADPRETAHRIRMCCGNGLAPDIWEAFKSRFQIPRILEFYAATEGNVSMFNVEGKPGAVGHIPSYLEHRFTAALVKFDPDKDAPVRNVRGFCIRCDADETGEAIGQIVSGQRDAVKHFEGYTNAEESEKKILRNVFEPGDSWFRTGDLMRRDNQGYFYFVDRIGDTFRWKGENVSASEVSQAICGFPGIKQASVYGVCLPEADGKAAMAILATDEEPNLEALRAHLYDCLPEYAHPLFLLIQSEVEMTSTFKHRKGRPEPPECDASAVGIYFNHRELGAFIPFDDDIGERLRTGRLRL